VTGFRSLAIALCACLQSCNVTTPTDWLINLGTFSHDPALKVRSDGSSSFATVILDPRGSSGSTSSS
jgi:hypothetical protein